MPRLRRWLSDFGYCRSEDRGVILHTMATIFEVEKLALDLSERERAKLAANLLDSLPGVLSDQDEGIAEALRRDAEIDGDPNQAMTLAQLDSQIQNRRR
jgi:putative addiction module component (TIGR02574 family)